MSRYATPPAPFAHVAMPGPRNRDAERAALQADVDAYLAAGGRISTTLPAHEREHDMFTGAPRDQSQASRKRGGKRRAGNRGNARPMR